MKIRNRRRNVWGVLELELGIISHVHMSSRAGVLEEEGSRGKALGNNGEEQFETIERIKRRKGELSSESISEGDADAVKHSPGRLALQIPTHSYPPSARTSLPDWNQLYNVAPNARRRTSTSWNVNQVYLSSNFNGLVETTLR